MRATSFKNIVTTKNAFSYNNTAAQAVEKAQLNASNKYLISIVIKC